MFDSPKPEVGTSFTCLADKLTKFNSKENACRIQLVDEVWVAVPPENRAGLIVFIRNPPDDLATLCKLTITEIGNRVAFAEPSAGQ